MKFYCEKIYVQEDVISCGGRLYKVKFVPDHPGITHFGHDEYKYVPVNDLIGTDERICEIRPSNYRTTNHTLQLIKLVFKCNFLL